MIHSRSQSMPGALRLRHGGLGFTMLEVLATLVLMGIVLPVAMRGISIALASAGTAKRSIEAAALAESKLNELIGVGMLGTGTMNAGTSSGDFGRDWPNYRWVSESSYADTDLLEISVHVFWPSRGLERSVTLTTFIYTAATQQAQTQTQSQQTTQTQ